MTEVGKSAIKALIKKSENANDSGDALKFTQAALNIAHTLSVVKSTVS